VRADEGVTFPTSDDLQADLRVVLGAMVGSFAEPAFERRHRALLTAIQDDEEPAAALWDRLLHPWLEATKERLRAAQVAGQVAADVDLDVAAELLYGPLSYGWLLRTGPVLPEYADTVVTLALRAIT